MARKCQALTAKPGKLMKSCSPDKRPRRHSKGTTAGMSPSFLHAPVFPCTKLAVLAQLCAVVVAYSIHSWWSYYGAQHAGEASSQTKKEVEWHDTRLQLLHRNMVRAEQLATGTIRSVSASTHWLESTLAVDKHLVATGAPEDIRGYTLSEIQRITLHHFPWNSLMSRVDLLQELARSLSVRMLMHDEVSTCCASDSCLYDQVATVMIFQQINKTDEAAAHLQAAKAAVISHGASAACRSMLWQLDRLVAPLDVHFPLGYENLIDTANEPAFWSASELPLAHHLEHHSEEIVAELAALCSPIEGSEAMGSVHFGPEKVVKNLAHGSWTSLPLLDNGAWNESACETLAPLTCTLLKQRPELQGALRSASVPDTWIQMTFVSVYRLRPHSHIHRHVGSPWRLNTHLGLLTPPGAKIRVWNESRQWEVGKAFAFLDAADHDVVHSGNTDRCVLNVVSWHPAVLERRLWDSSFAKHFAFQDSWEKSADVYTQDR